MSRRPRRNHSPAFKAKVALAAVKGGRPPLDPVMMFKVLVIQAANNLSDERADTSLR